MSLLEKLSNSNPQTPNIHALYQEFVSNPVGFLVRSKFNIPQNVTNPQQIVQHLASTGQVPPQMQQRVNQMLYRK